MPEDSIDITSTHIAFKRAKKKRIDIWNLEELTGEAQNKRVNDFSDVRVKLGPRTLEQFYVEILSFMYKPVENEHDRYEFFKSLQLINRFHINKKILNLLESQNLIWQDIGWGDWDDNWNEKTRWQIRDEGVEILRFLESGGKLSELCFVYLRSADHYVYARTPILFKKDNQVQIIYGGKIENDSIILLGKVVEKLGAP